VSTTPDFSVAVSPSSVTVAPGGTATLTVTTAKVNSSTQTVSLSVSGLPSGVTGSFNPTSVTAGGSSTLTLTASSTASGSGTVTNPPATTWYVMLNGYATYSGVTLTATYSATTNTTPALSNNVPVTGIAGATGSTQFWKLTVPAGQTQVVFSISGGTGDADL